MVVAVSLDAMKEEGAACKEEEVATRLVTPLASIGTTQQQLKRKKQSKKACTPLVYLLLTELKERKHARTLSVSLSLTHTLHRRL